MKSLVLIINEEKTVAEKNKPVTVVYRSSVKESSAKADSVLELLP